MDNIQHFPPLDSTRLVIRELDREDVCDYYAFASHPEVARYMSWYPHRNMDESFALIQKVLLEYQQQNIYTLGIIHKNDHKLIGAIGLSRRNLTDEKCEVWYALSYHYWHQGLMPEALKRFCDYLFASGKRTIIATCLPENENSAKVMLKAGFKRDVNYDGPYMIKGREVQLIGYSLKAGE